MAGRTKPKRRRATPRVIRSYTPWHELMASPTEPLPPCERPGGQPKP